MSCVFCQLIASGQASWVTRQEHAVAFIPLPESSLAPGHTLVVPRHHCTGVLDAPPDVLAAAIGLVQEVGQAMIKSLDATGIVVLNASGPNSGQSVAHLHFHVVPRWADCGTDMWPEHASRHSVQGDPCALLASAFSEREIPRG